MAECGNFLFILTISIKCCPAFQYCIHNIHILEKSVIF